MTPQNPGTPGLLLIPASSTFATSCWPGWGEVNNRAACDGVNVPEPSGLALLVVMVAALFAVRLWGRRHG